MGEATWSREVVIPLWRDRGGTVNRLVLFLIASFWEISEVLNGPLTSPRGNAIRADHQGRPLTETSPLGVAGTIAASSEPGPIPQANRSVAKLAAVSIVDSLLPPHEPVQDLTGYSTSTLRHVYTPDRLGIHGRPMDFRCAEDRLKEVDTQVRMEYQREYAAPMNTYDPAVAAAVRHRYWENPSTAAAFEALGLPTELIRAAYIPWWNERAAHESKVSVTSDAFIVEIAPRHSIETQLRRSGYDIPVRNISVGGVVVTPPSEPHPCGEIVLGLRGGLTARNTFHIPAGALRLTDELICGRHSIADVLRGTELHEEFGIKPSHITSLRPLARYSDASIGLEVYYTFAATLNLSFNDLLSVWRANKNADKQEHQFLIAVDARAEHVVSFITQWYRGKARNTADRPDSERCLLHAAAVAMAVYAGVDPQKLLRPLCRERDV